MLAVFHNSAKNCGLQPNRLQGLDHGRIRTRIAVLRNSIGKVSWWGPRGARKP